ncbi:MAG: hypothetical protein WDW38_008563 [Sanguina aurantia]
MRLPSQMLIDLVLATDMKQHFSIISQFGALHRLQLQKRNSGESSLSITPSMLESIDSSKAPPQQALHRSPSVKAPPPLLESFGSARGMVAKTPLDETERLLSLQMALKLADLGHLSAPLHVHLRWVAALEEEFFRQGDAEKACMLPVSPLFDRTKPGITKSQVGFFDVVLLPCVTQFVIVFQGCKPMLKGIRANYKHWERRDAGNVEATESPKQPVSLGEVTERE